MKGVRLYNLEISDDKPYTRYYSVLVVILDDSVIKVTFRLGLINGRLHKKMSTRFFEHLRDTYFSSEESLYYEYLFLGDGNDVSAIENHLKKKSCKLVNIWKLYEYDEEK
jgi:hypothetical protein